MKIRLEHKSALLPQPELGALIRYCWDPNSLGVVTEATSSVQDKVNVLWSRLPDEQCRRPIKYTREHLSIVELFKDIFQVLKLFFQDIIDKIMTCVFFVNDGFNEEHFLSNFDL